MKPANIRRSFARAGFPLRTMHLGREWKYQSSRIEISLFAPRYSERFELTVWVNRRPGIMVRFTRTDFDSARDALRYIRRVLAIEVAVDNEWSLRTEPRGSLRLVDAA